MPDITCNNVDLFYGKNQALGDVSFTIKENTICGLLGRNGAGKTSLMSLLASFRQASSGEVLYDGKPLYDSAEAMPHIIFVYSRKTDASSMKVREYLRGCANFRPNWDDTYAKQLLSDFGINTNKSLDSLSLGQQASVYAISGLASRCPLTLYDEAYLGMDAAIRKRFIQEVLEDYLRVPRTIIFSTHFIGEIENMLEDVLVLDEGKVLLHENCDTLRGRGFAITGGVATVESFVEGLAIEVLSARQLGGQKEVVVYGELSAEQQSQASAQGLDLTQPSLQDIFVHITEAHASKSHDTAADNNSNKRRHS